MTIERTKRIRSLACLLLFVIAIGCDNGPEQAVVPTTVPEGAIEDGRKMSEAYSKTLDMIELVPAN